MHGNAFDPETVLRELPADLRLFSEKIQTLQRRIGTPAEQPADLEDLRQLAHKYMNSLTEYYGARQLSLPPFLEAYKTAHKPTGS